MGLFLGLISGTSMDAIDAALVDFGASRSAVLATNAYPFEPSLKNRILAALESPRAVDLDEIGRLDVEVGRAFAEAARALLASSRTDPATVTAIGSHGQTLRHCIAPPVAFTWQIGDPNVIAESTGITTVADFRRRDVAAGGQGAPLVPLFHDRMFRREGEDRVVLNIGGIANISLLTRGRPVRGFDTGPGNRLLDAWSLRHRNQAYDLNGDWAKSGRIDPGLLTVLMSEPYLAANPPKSTGRELFNLAWLDARVPRNAAPQDVQATLLEFTCRSIADAISSHAPGANVYVCGGGAHNRPMIDRLGVLLAPASVQDTSVLGMDPDFVEAAAFAWLAQRCLEGEPTDAASVTGAKGARVLGGVYRA